MNSDEKIYPKILQKIGRAKSILDIGYARGEFATFMALKLKKKIVGLDISDSGFAKAKRKALREKIPQLIECIKGDAHKMKFVNREFEAVTLLYTLHHLKHPKIALKEIKRVLKPNGKFLVVECIAERKEVKNPCCKFTIKKIQTMLKETGFKNLSVELIKDIALIVGIK